MKRLGVRARIVLVTVGLAVLVGGPVGGLVEWRLRTQMHEIGLRNLERSAQAAHAHLQAHGSADLDESADVIADALGVRITIIDRQGTVLADSELDDIALAAMANHSDRPEVVRAWSTGGGRSTRWSATLRHDMQYVAVETRLHGAPAVVRSAAPLKHIHSTINQLRLTLLLGAALAIVLALITGTLAAAWVGNMLRSLVQGAQTLAAGDARVMPQGTSVEGLGRTLEHTVRDLAGERNQLQAVLAAVGDGVVAVDDHLQITMLNAQAQQLLGRRATVGAALVDAGGGPMVDLAHAAILGEYATEEIRWKGPPRRTLEITAARFEHQEGCVLVLHDLTALRRLERVRSDFVANVSHELRTPISIIAATTETLLAGAIDDPKARKRFVKATHRHATRLGALVNDLLSLSRIEAGQMPLHPRELAVSTVVKRIVEDTIQDQDRVTLDLAAGLQVYADPLALEHALSNLVENAVKYSPAESPILVRAYDAASRTVIEVADEGPGIQEEHRNRVFERFYRVDAGRSRAVGGTGLGLSIVKHLASAMGGRVSAHANEPNGSIFRLELPSRPEAPPTTLVGTQRPAAAETTLESTTPADS